MISDDQPDIVNKEGGSSVNRFKVHPHKHNVGKNLNLPAKTGSVVACVNLYRSWIA